MGGSGSAICFGTWRHTEDERKVGSGVAEVHWAHLLYRRLRSTFVGQGLGTFLGRSAGFLDEEAPCANVTCSLIIYSWCSSGRLNTFYE